MARTNRVIVSPGVYTSEKELTYVAQSIGITTLGMAGETLKGPAFEPVLISNYDEFRTYFGGTSVEKFENGNPKYELPFFAKSYLQQSNQLFVTRVLGLTGFRAGTSWGIVTEGTGEYDGVVVAMLRSRGSYSGSTLTYQVTDATGVTMTSTGVTSNPLAEFEIDVNGKTFTMSMDKTSKTFVTKVVGSGIFDKSETEFPLYVSEEYSNWLADAWAQGNVTGLSTTLVNADETDNYLGEWATAHTPWIVSEVRGGKVNDLFRFITVSDGDASNTEVKISITNVSVENLEFDVVVRDFNDTDDAPVVIEKFTRCSMNPDIPGYVGKKIGSSDGEYELKSRFVMIELKEGHPTDAVPAGFRGYPRKEVNGSTVGSVVYKTKYYTAGETIATNPATISNGDKIRKNYLGFSSQRPSDASLLKFKGESLSGETKGFHLSSEASTITDDDGNVLFITNTISFENPQSGEDYETLNACKFTVMTYGGFDGWDVYRGSRTNTDAYQLGKTAYTEGSVSGTTGVFNTIASGGDPNSDYYAYLKAIQVYNNPEAININVLSTPGIDFYNHSKLVSEAIDIVEIDRADCLYVVNSPNVDMEDVIDYIDYVGLDSSYTATYWPWIQVKDTDNGSQLYIPPTGEVLKNLAYTDNVAHPWFASAGVNRGKVNAIKAKAKLTLDQRDDLYKSRINPIATFANEGTVIWGNKTLQVHESPLDRINVRRLLLQARKLIAAVSLRLLFDQNDEEVRNEFERMVNPILTNIQNERGLNDFRVVVSRAPEDYDTNTLKGTIYIRPTRSLEFVEIQFSVTPTAASFENV